MEIKAGRYPARVVDAGLQQAGTGTLQAVMRFAFEIDGQPTQMNWYGSFTDKAKEFTIEALIKAGFGGTDIEDLRKGREMFHPDREVEIVIEPHTYNGKTSMRIAYVNLPGDRGFKDLAPEATRGVSFKGDFMAARQKLGSVATKTPPQARPDIHEADIPF